MLPSSHPELLVRFAKESSVKKSELFSDIDTIDVQPRQEPLKIRGEPQLLQLPIVPAYALRIHKTQVLGTTNRPMTLFAPAASLASYFFSPTGSFDQTPGEWVYGRHICTRTALRVGVAGHRTAEFCVNWCTTS